jgi:hypothetical protein
MDISIVVAFYLSFIQSWFVGVFQGRRAPTLIRAFLQGTIAAYLIGVVWFGVFMVVLVSLFPVGEVAHHFGGRSSLPFGSAVHLVTVVLGSPVLPALTGGYFAVLFRVRPNRPRLTPAVEKAARARFTPDCHHADQGWLDPGTIRPADDSVRENESAG